MAAARVNWHGQDLPVVREIVEIGGVETAVEIPELARTRASSNRRAIGDTGPLGEGSPDSPRIFS